MSDCPLNSFAELVLRMEKGRDYEVIVHDVGTKMTVAAIHGGGIAPLTDNLAQEIAGGQHNLYILRSLLPYDSDVMRIPSIRFTEMRIDGLLQRSRTSLSIDGVDGSDMVVRLGGPNRMLASQIADHVRQTGYEVGEVAFPEAACSRLHFYNRPQLKGIQIELSAALRQAMVEGPLATCAKVIPAYTDLFRSFVSAVKAAIDDYQREVGADLDLTMERFESATANFGPSLRDIHHRH